MVKTADKTVHACEKRSETRRFDWSADVRPHEKTEAIANESTHASNPMNVKPRSLFQARRRQPAARPPIPSLNALMVEVAADDLHASPCVTCGRPGSSVAVWTPTGNIIAQELDGNPARSRALFYRLCVGCSDRLEHDRQFVAIVEAAVLRLWRAGNVHRIIDGASVP